MLARRWAKGRVRTKDILSGVGHEILACEAVFVVVDSGRHSVRSGRSHTETTVFCRGKDLFSFEYEQVSGGFFPIAAQVSGVMCLSRTR